VNGEGGEELLYASAEDKFGTDISPDGRFLLYYSAGQTATKSDIWALPLVGDRKPILLVQSEFEEVDPQFSPDGKWIAYTSNESGRNEVYVRPFPGPGGKWQISTTGVNVAAIVLAPRWSRDGRELYFHTADQKLVAAQIKISGSSVDIGEIKPMFDTQSRALLYIVAASADGQRFLSLSNASQLSSPLTLVLNWDEEFR